MRTKLVAGNWKMYKTLREARSFSEQLTEFADLLLNTRHESLICAPFTALFGLHDQLAQMHVKLGAQNMHEMAEGAFTGEVSAPMLKELQCEYVILGHSERRQYFAESDDAVARKAMTALNQMLTPIVCVGETLEEREAGATRSVVSRQLGPVLQALKSQSAKALDATALVIAYEPIWAIGSGRSSEAKDAEEVAAWIRSLVTASLGSDAASQVRVLYGGSVKPENIVSYVEQPNIDGALVGGASLQPASFAALVQQVATITS